MLTLYRRHLAGCSHKEKGRTFKRCRCPIWLQGTLSGESFRKSLDVTNWERAEELKSEIENGAKPEPPKKTTIKEALTAFVLDCEARNLNPSTLAKYKLLSKRLQTFAQSKSIRDLQDFTTGDATVFRGSWQGSPRTLSKMLERLRAFFRFCVDNDWIAKSPAKSIRSPQVRDTPTLPFTDPELAKLMDKSDFRTQVFFRVLLHSGLRIIDAAQLRPEKIIEGKLFLYTQKTGVPVYIPLPPDLLADLSTLPLVGGFYFAIQSASPRSIAEHYRQKLNKAAIDAGLGKKKVPGSPRGKNTVHPHRFRDTFAVRLLEKGVPLETVSILLGHTDIQTTQRSYSPWIASLQANLELAVQKTWSTKLVRVK
jgi:integrase